MQVTSEFAPSDRYVYDFRLCTTAKGWAQIDTKQDASYYGSWTNPTTREIFTYCEGDTTHKKCETEEEYKQELMSLVDWNKDNGYWLGIDPGFNTELKAAFTTLGLSSLLH